MLTMNSLALWEPKQFSKQTIRPTQKYSFILPLLFLKICAKFLCKINDREIVSEGLFEGSGDGKNQL